MKGGKNLKKKTVILKTMEQFDNICDTSLKKEPETEPSAKRLCTVGSQKINFNLRLQGEEARLSVPYDNRIPLYIPDINYLLIYTQRLQKTPYPLKWCGFTKQNLLSTVNILIVENVSLYQYEAYSSNFEKLNEAFDFKFEVVSPSSYNRDTIMDIATIPMTHNEKVNYLKKYGTIEKAAEECKKLFDLEIFPTATVEDEEEVQSLPNIDKFPRTQLLLSGWQMIEENFPLPIRGLMERKYKGYVLTKDEYQEVTANSPMYGLDCEMCLTAINESELTRVSVVDEQMKVIYEELVKPPNKITNYLTRYSGITAKMMAPVRKTLEDVQKELRDVLPPNAILIGQSLSNDLHALKMMHPYVIDTSVIFNLTGQRDRKSKLQILSSQFLQENIQNSRQGHCSIEDSSACVKLTKLKLSKDLLFGDAVLNKGFRKFDSVQQDSIRYGKSLLTELTYDLNKKACVIGSEDAINKFKSCTYKQDALQNPLIGFSVHNSNKEVVNALLDQMTNNNINLAHLEAPKDHCDDSTDLGFLKKLDRWSGKIVDSSPSNSINIVLFTGNASSNGCCFINIK
ncbi:PREDICTED: putative RNA exonuclease NEF-sp [Nicrophorus vespilloides]|uniref:RNA exonuclease NEF-sp n=1 Tax=Nicrophorus vespilloides TaxID=110193 RepID=A0ABM1M3K1_NICVS|nr:PREDICTED: putative RNA exonuclease NEF-sp [Nicrophorus vespilloides]XP_017769151.1 PREDICTED: putative RNA exonuclease NEF-sp [Nicrophorus vespilloides]